MSLEACMIIVDNSEYTRNGDFAPSRFQSQLDAVSILSRNKTGANAESSVGIVDTSGPTCHMSLVTDADLEKLMASLHRIDIKGEIHLVSAINVAMLALKHRINKIQEQRVICFVGSPVTETAQELTALGTRMKKNKVAIDVVSFGEVSSNEEKLQALVNAANSGDNSHYTAIATKPYVNLMDELAGSTVFSTAMSAGPADDDLEMAIRLSLAEQGGGAAPAAAGAAGAPGNNAMDMDDEDAQMAQAIAMSMGGAALDAAPTNNQGGVPGAGLEDAMGEMDEELAMAIRLSMQENTGMDVDAKPAEEDKPAPKTEVKKEPEEEDQPDPATLQSLIESVGVDPNDPNFKDLVAALNKDAEEEKKKKDGESKDGK